MWGRTAARAVFLGLLLALVGFLATSAVAGGPGPVPADDGTLNRVDGTSIAGLTVVTTDPHLGPGAEPNPGAIAAYDATGELVYYNDTYTKYYDVDPSPLGSATVLYVSGRDLNRSACPAKPRTELMGTRDGCRENVVERLNLTTGEATRIYTFYTDWRRWHDVDRLDEHRLAVADLARNRVFVLNTTSGLIEWQWDAQSDVSIASGGAFPGEFTHVNDVEVLDDGRVMVSVRNQDQVVFIDRETGLQPNWTLGAEDDYEILREQHNPDYIPPERGGPAVLVGDSENNRVVEYQRVNGSWHRSWIWRDAATRWPRDVDRLPNGHTLIADSDGGRVVEVDRAGDVVWSIRVDTPYDAERLGTGPESAGGDSAASLGLRSRTIGGQRSGPTDAADTESAGWFALLVSLLDRVVPGFVVNGVLYATPGWMGLAELLAAAMVAGLLSLWGAAELYWTGYRLRSPLAKREP